MAKTSLTLRIENKLYSECKHKRLYGCAEVTIGFPRQRRGNEIVDFMSMDSRGIFKCYELKVSLSDFKSDAKLSFYGDYNYLVISEKLAEHLDYIKQHIPEYVGIYVASEATHYRQNFAMKDGVEPYDSVNLKSIRTVKKQTVDEEMRNILKDSLIRTLYFKMEKFKDGCDEKRLSSLKAEARAFEKSYKDEHRRCRDYELKFYRLVRKLIREGRSEEEVEKLYT